MFDQVGLPSNPSHLFRTTKEALIIRLSALKCKAGCQPKPEGQAKLGGVISQLTGEWLTFCGECLSKSTLKHCKPAKISF